MSSLLRELKDMVPTFASHNKRNSSIAGALAVLLLGALLAGVLLGLARRGRKGRVRRLLSRHWPKSFGRW